MALPAKFARLRQAPRRAEQHRGMPVMAAGVHLARGLGPIGKVGLFLDRQRVHVRAQSDRTRARSLGAADDADDTGAADRRFDLVATEAAKALSDEFRRLLDVIHDFGLLMQFSAPGSHFGNEVVDGGADRHRNGILANSRQVAAARKALSTIARRSALAMKKKNRLIAQEIPRPLREDWAAAAGP